VVVVYTGFWAHAGSGEYCALDSFVDFGAVYIVCLFTSYTSLLILFSRRIGPLYFLVGGCKRRPNLDFFTCFSLFFLL